MMGMMKLDKNLPQIVSPKVVCGSSEVVGSKSSTEKPYRNFEGSCVQIGNSFDNNSAFTAVRPEHEINLSPVEKPTNCDEVARDEQSSPTVFTQKQQEHCQRQSYM